MRVSFSHSHVFPGCRATVVDVENKGQDCLVEFADGLTVLARRQDTQQGVLISIPAYRTRKRNWVDSRRWLLERRGNEWRARAV